jgi:hypothetical protein
MPNRQTDSALGQVHSLLKVRSLGRLTDQQLLQQFLVMKEEVAFATLVERHGPMVLSVCQAVLHHTQDAEDVFQATFLVLARKSASIRKQGSLALGYMGLPFGLPCVPRLSEAKPLTARSTRPRRPVHWMSSAAASFAKSSTKSWNDCRRAIGSL